jgi:alkylation response protein AidB-like acyl-CoA dehydrogenase
VWSSYAHLADWCILVVRTDPEAEKHRGLSYLLVDMHSPGVEVRPLRQITGDPEFNEIFFTDVRVPRDSMLGQPGDGWSVAMTTLLHERGTLGFALTAALEKQVNRLLRLARELGRADDPLVRDGLARAWIDLQALRFTNYRALTSLERTGVPGPEGSVAKLHWSETNQWVTKLALSLEGMASQLDHDGAVWDGYWQYQQLRSRGNTIEAGTSEILRNIIAERVVGLPRSR